MPASLNFCDMKKNQEIKAATTYKSYVDLKINSKEQVGDLGIMMSITQPLSPFILEK